MNPTWTLGESGNGSWGPFHRIWHTSGFSVTHFPTGQGLVVCHRPEHCPEWHRTIMAALKTDQPYTVASASSASSANVCGDILGFLKWVESHQPETSACAAGA